LKKRRSLNLDYVDAFDGIWACASLLHVSRKDLADVFRRLERALKKGGILYASFKVGSNYSESSRSFLCLQHNEIEEFLQKNTNLIKSEIIRTHDVREQVFTSLWVNIFLEKER
jgi:SAM-dependent methyltransferase